MSTDLSVMGTLPESGEFKYIVRWIAFIPVAALASWLVQIITSILSRLVTLLSGQNPDSFLNRAHSTILVGALVGYSFIRCGVYIAPNNKKAAAGILGGLAMLFSGANLALAMQSGAYDGWYCTGTLFNLVAAGVTAFLIIRDGEESVRL